MKASIEKIIRVIEGEIRGAKGQELADLNDVLQGVIDMLDLRRCLGCEEIYDDSENKELIMLSDKCCKCSKDEDDLQATKWYLNDVINKQRI